MNKDETAALARTVAFFNGKGGVGKTSSVANIAGHLAANGFHVLLIDMDESGNLALNLGVRGSDIDDRGSAIFEAIQDEDPLPPPHPVRAGIDMYFGGVRLRRFTPLEASGELSAHVGEVFAQALAPVASEYDFVLLDCPPGNLVLQQMALATARYVAIPVNFDPASWDGITTVGPLVSRARKVNPELTFLGAYVFANPTSASRMLKVTRVKLAEVSDRIPLFETAIRSSQAIAQQARVDGRLISEMAEKAAPESLVSRLSGDYRELAREIVAAIAVHEKAARQKEATNV